MLHVEEDLGCLYSCPIARACSSSTQMAWQHPGLRWQHRGFWEQQTRFYCQTLVPCTGSAGLESTATSLAGGGEGKHVEMLSHTDQEVSSAHQIPTLPEKAFVLNLSSFPWAKLLRIITLPMSCSVQEEQPLVSKGLRYEGRGSE